MTQGTPLRVTVCVPVFNAAQWIAESLDSVKQQSFADFDVLVSDDASTDGSADICRRFTDDPRFRVVVQPERLGWAGNCNWLMSRARSEFLLIQCHDDVLDVRCIETLFRHIADDPACCVAFPDIKAFGNENYVLSQQSISGNALQRAFDMIAHHYNAPAFHGLIRTNAAAEGLPVNRYDSFAADTAWLMKLARSGELHRVEHAVLHKRYHQDMTHLQWTRWEDERKIAAWGTHCRDMLNEALRLDLSATQRSLLVFAALQRLLLIGNDFGPYGFIRDLSDARKGAMVADLLASIHDDTDAVDQATASLVVQALEAPYAGMMKVLSRANADRAAYQEQIDAVNNFLKEANADRVASHARIDALEGQVGRQKDGPWQRLMAMMHRTLRTAMRARVG